jgi:2-phospho-L-lactate/phosphoenolpyruvate guanylyltransferase
MRTIAILPVKSFGAAKQRLAGVLGGSSRRALALAMFSDVLASLRHVEGLDEVAVVTADREAGSVALSNGAWVLRDEEETGQSRAALVGVRHAIGDGFERALLVPGDTPLLDPAEVSALLARDLELAIVPDRHGTGTNALLLRPPDAIEPAFGPGSLERHVDRARAAGVGAALERVGSLLLDVDTPEDLAELGAQLERRPGAAPMTRGVLRRLDRARARGESVAPRGAERPPVRA